MSMCRRCGEVIVPVENGDEQENRKSDLCNRCERDSGEGFKKKLDRLIQTAPAPRIPRER